MSDESSSTQSQAASLMARVFALVRACPPGRVTTYGWIGKALGYPRGARMIGWIMNETPPGVPAQRVLNSKGELSGSWAFGEPGRMRNLLEAEGIVFSGERVNLKQYGWDPSTDLTDEERTHILDAADSSSIVMSGRLVQLMEHDPASFLRDTSNNQ